MEPALAGTYPGPQYMYRSSPTLAQTTAPSASHCRRQCQLNLVYIIRFSNH